MSQIPDGTNKNDAVFMTTAQRAAQVAGSVASRARVALPDSSNEGRLIIDNGEDSRFPHIAPAPNSGLPDSHNPRG